MLVLTRKKHEKIIIKTRTGELITLCIVDHGMGRVRIGVAADPETKILREEIFTKAYPGVEYPTAEPMNSME